MEISFTKNSKNPTIVVDSEVKPGTPVDIDKAFAESPGVEVNPHAAPQQSMLPATIGPGATEFAGDYLPGFKDVILPRINIVQGVGQLKDSFPQGAIVYGQSLALFTPPIIDKATGNVKQASMPPVEIIVLGFRPTRYVEKISGGERGMLVNSEAEVRAAGGTTDYNEWNLKKASGMKRFETLAEAFILIKRPKSVADDDSVFIFKGGDDKFALALWAMKGTAYTHAAKRVFFTARMMGCLSKEGYPSWSYNFTTRSETGGGNTYFVPVCVPNAPTTPPVRDLVKSILNPGAAPVDPAAAR